MDADSSMNLRRPSQGGKEETQQERQGWRVALWKRHVQSLNSISSFPPFPDWAWRRCVWLTDRNLPLLKHLTPQLCYQLETLRRSSSFRQNSSDIYDNPQEAAWLALCFLYYQIYNCISVICKLCALPWEHHSLCNREHAPVLSHSRGLSTLSLCLRESFLTQSNKARAMRHAPGTKHSHI